MDLKSLFLVNLSVLAITLIPLWAILITRIKLEGKIYYALLQQALVILTIVTFMFPPVRFKISFFFYFYSLFLMLYIDFLVEKFGFQNMQHSLAIGLLMVFIAANYWEIPVYVYAALGLSDFKLWVALPYHIHHVYVLACFWLLQRMSGFRFNRTNTLTLSLGVLFLFPLLLLHVIPLIFRLMFARLIGLIIFGYSILSGIPEGNFKGLD